MDNQPEDFFTNMGELPNNISLLDSKLSSIESLIIKLTEAIEEECNEIMSLYRSCGLPSSDTQPHIDKVQNSLDKFMDSTNNELRNIHTVRCTLKTPTELLDADFYAKMIWNAEALINRNTKGSMIKNFISAFYKSKNHNECVNLMNTHFPILGIPQDIICQCEQDVKDDLINKFKEECQNSLKIHIIRYRRYLHNIGLSADEIAHIEGEGCSRSNMCDGEIENNKKSSWLKILILAIVVVLAFFLIKYYISSSNEKYDSTISVNESDNHSEIVDKYNNEAVECKKIINEISNNLVPINNLKVGKNTITYKEYAAVVDGNFDNVAEMEKRPQLLDLNYFTKMEIENFINKLNSKTGGNFRVMTFTEVNDNLDKLNSENGINDFYASSEYKKDDPVNLPGAEYPFRIVSDK